MEVHRQHICRLANSEEHLKEFLQDFNVFHPIIKFTTEWSRESVMFLDVKVIRDGNLMVNDLYSKLTDTHQYLHCHSCHPSHCKKSIAFSQALRLLRLSAKTTDYERHVKELQGYLVERGYDGGEIQKQINAATKRTGEELSILWVTNIEQVMPLVVMFHPHLPHLMLILHDHQCVINTSMHLKGALPRPLLLPIATPQS